MNENPYNYVCNFDYKKNNIKDCDYRFSKDCDFIQVLKILNTLYKLYPKKLEERYGITLYNDDLFVETLDIIGKKRGCLIKGGEIDYDKVFNIILNDIKNGYIKEITFDRY